MAAPARYSSPSRHRLQVERRMADDLEHIADCCLLVARLAELGGAPVDFLSQLGDGLSRIGLTAADRYGHRLAAPRLQANRTAPGRPADSGEHPRMVPLRDTGQAAGGNDN